MNDKQAFSIFRSFAKSVLDHYYQYEGVPLTIAVIRWSGELLRVTAPNTTKVFFKTVSRIRDNRRSTGVRYILTCYEGFLTYTEHPGGEVYRVPVVTITIDGGKLHRCFVLNRETWDAWYDPYYESEGGWLCLSLPVPDDAE